MSRGHNQSINVAHFHIYAPWLDKNETGEKYSCLAQSDINTWGTLNVIKFKFPDIIYLISFNNTQQ